MSVSWESCDALYSEVVLLQLLAEPEIVGQIFLIVLHSQGLKLQSIVSDYNLQGPNYVG